MKQTFFDYIGTADMERVHSATIAWMISDQCNAFNLEERVSLLNCLFETSKADIVSIDVCTEYEHIDIAFITTGPNGDQEFWAIENKVKAPLGYNQLKNYEHIINPDEPAESKEDEHKPTEREKEYAYAKQKYKETHFAVLSLIGTLPQDEAEKWHCVTYSELLHNLKLICDKKDNENQHFAIIKEYRDCLHNLDYVLKEFEKHPEKYPNVFTDGSKKNSEKVNRDTGSPVGNYISKNGLETLLQKYYFVEIINKIDRIKTGHKYHYHVSETHGNADFAFHFDDLKYDEYIFDLSFQCGTFKLAVSKKGYPSLKSDLEFLKKWEGVFNCIANNFPYNKVNKPKSRARISVSYNLGSNWYNKYDRNNFIKVILSQIEIAYDMMNFAIQLKDCNKFLYKNSTNRSVAD